MAPLIFCFDTALEIMRRGRLRLAARPRTELPLDNTCCRVRSLSNTPWQTWLTKKQPVHLLSSLPSMRRQSPGCIVHAWGHLGESWPVIDLGEDVFVVAPEFLFLQMATVLNDIALAFLGFELCGVYGFAKGSINKASTITTVQDIERFLLERPKARGRAKALRAIKRVIDGSASPMETELVMRLTYPVRMGGYGLPAPLLNHPIDLHATSAQSIGVSTIKPDIVWLEGNIALEYDSDSEHVGAEHITHDARRRIALEAEGLQVVTVTNAQLRNRRDVEDIARVVSRALGKRQIEPSADARRARIALGDTVHELAINPALLTLAGNVEHISQRQG